MPQVRRADDCATPRLRQRRATGLWAPCLSALCFLHCAGMALIVPWVPALAAFGEAPWLEWTMLGVSAISASWVLARLRPSRAAWLSVTISVGLVLWGLAREREGHKQVGFLALAAIQGGLVFSSRRRNLHRGCCEAEAERASFS